MPGTVPYLDPLQIDAGDVDVLPERQQAALDVTAHDDPAAAAAAALHLVGEFGVDDCGVTPVTALHVPVAASVGGGEGGHTGYLYRVKCEVMTACNQKDSHRQ